MDVPFLLVVIAWMAFCFFAYLWVNRRWNQIEEEHVKNIKNGWSRPPTISVEAEENGLILETRREEDHVNIPKTAKQPFATTNRPYIILVLATIVTVMLFAALAKLPYGYYRLLRWVVCISSAIMIVQAYNRFALQAVIIFILIAVLFNPIWPIHLWRKLWRVLDVYCAVLFLGNSLLMFYQDRLLDDVADERLNGPKEPACERRSKSIPPGETRMYHRLII